MTAQENLEVMRQVAEAFERNDMQALDQLIADDVVWHEIGRAEPRRGKEELRASMASGFGGYEITGSTHDTLATDDHAVMLVNATATRDGKTLHYRTAEIHHIRNGQIVERWAFSDDTAAITDFFA